MNKALPLVVVLAVIVSATVLAALGIISGSDAKDLLEGVLGGAIGGGALHLSLKE